MSSVSEEHSVTGHDVPEEISAEDVGTIKLTFRDECVADDDAFELPDR
jgi:hypothetical protein